MRIITGLFLTLLLFLIYILAENNMLIVRKYQINIKLPNEKKLKIVQISDLHNKKYPNNWQMLYSRIKSLSPDIIIISGDLVSRTQTDFRYTGKLIKRLSDICPAYYSKGNHELDLSEKNMSLLRNEVIKNGGLLLENQLIKVNINDIPLSIYGADLKKGIYKNKDGRFKNLESYTSRELSEIFGKPQSMSLLIAHNPFFFKEYADWGADITFSGHVHAGIINTPFGGLLSPERKFFPKFTKGIYSHNNKKMVVSAGIGKLRIFNPSEILFLEIK